MTVYRWIGHVRLSNDKQGRTESVAAQAIV